MAQSSFNARSTYTCVGWIQTMPQMLHPLRTTDRHMQNQACLGKTHYLDLSRWLDLFRVWIWGNAAECRLWLQYSLHVKKRKKKRWWQRANLETTKLPLGMRKVFSSTRKSPPALLMQLGTEQAECHVRGIIKTDSLRKPNKVFFPGI